MIISNNFSDLYNCGVAVFVQPPAKRNLYFNLSQLENSDGMRYKGFEDINDRYFLSFPYVGFSIHYVKKQEGISLHSLYLAFSTNLQMTHLFLPSLTNISINLHVCLGITPSMNSIEDLCKDVVGNFWSSEFNEDLDCCLYEYSHRSILGSPILWQNKTKKNSSWVPTCRNLISSDARRCDFFGEFLFS
jgi:hypothetical protein